MRILIRQSWARAGYDIWLLKERGPDLWSVAQPTDFVFEDKDGSFMLPEPTIKISRHDYEGIRKSLEDELISNGFLKSSAFLDGELKATKAHLEDMRTLVLK